MSVSYRKRALPKGTLFDATGRGLISAESAYNADYAGAFDRVSHSFWGLFANYHDEIPPMGDFSDYEDTVSTDQTGTYLGSFFHEPSNPEIGDYYWDRSRHSLRERVFAFQGFAPSASWHTESPFTLMSHSLPLEHRTRSNFHWLGHTDEDTDALAETALLRGISTPINPHGYYVGVANGTVRYLTVSSFVASVNPWTSHDWELFHGPGPTYRNNPSAIWYGIGQTERWPSNYPNTQDGLNLRRLQFAEVAGGGPNEVFDGWNDAVPDTIWVPGDDVSTSIDSGAPGRTTERVVFTLPAGRYHIWIHSGWNEESTATQQSFSMRRITTGDDDVQIDSSPGIGNDTEAGENIFYTAALVIRNLVLDGSEQFYLAWDHIPNEDNTRHQMVIEQVAA